MPCLIASSLAWWVEGEGTLVHNRTLTRGVMRALPSALPSLPPPHRAIPPAALPGPPLTAVTACH